MSFPGDPSWCPLSLDIQMRWCARCDCRDGAVGNGVRDEIVKMRSLRSSRRRCRDEVIEKGLSRRRDHRDVCNPDPSGSRVCVPLVGSMWDGCPIVDEIGWVVLHAVAVGWIDVGWLPRCRCHHPWAASKP